MKFLIMLAVVFSSQAMAAEKSVDLVVEQKSVNLSGKKEVDFALMVNGGIPAPTLRFQEGDTVNINVHNRLNEEVSIHWHGLLLPPEQDGVAYVNTPPIHAGKSHTFRFTLRQHGTYWYHSHTGLQEQKGVYGAFIIEPKKSQLKVDHDLVAILSDWSDENADTILKKLKKDGDYYLYKKNSIRSYFGAIGAGGLGELLKNEWMRMGGMDLSDVGYDAFLINGKKESQMAVAHPGEKVRVRIINSGASSYFYVSLAGLPFQVISADGTDVQPFWARELLMGMAETYDILFTVPEHKNYELRATVQDITGYGSAWIGMGEKVNAPTKAPIDLYAPMDHGGHGNHGSTSSHNGHVDQSGASDHSGHNTHGETATAPAKSNHEGHGDHAQLSSHNEHQAHTDHASAKKPATKDPHAGHSAPAKNAPAKDDILAEAVTVDHLRAKEKTAFSPDQKVLEVKLVLGGDMERYVWHINGKAIHEDRNLIIHEGQVIRYTMVNETMMHHPMHLHGHFFRVLNAGGDRSPLKHTVDVPPHSERTIEFLANEPGEWMLHCHNLFHMKTGMARVVKYSTFSPSATVAQHQKHDPHLHDHIYWKGSLEAATQMAAANFQLMRTWDSVSLTVESQEEDRKWKMEGDLLYRRWQGNYWNWIVGGTSFLEHQRGMIGVGVILPFLIEADVFVDHKADLRLQAEKKFQWTKNFLSEAKVNWREKEGAEWETNLLYQPSWHWGVGVFRNQEKWGLGAKIQF